VQELRVQTKQAKQVVDITQEVTSAVSESGVKEGFCLVFVPHATAGVILNEFEPNIASDYLKWLEEFFPKKNWAHNRIDDNAEAHLKSAIIGPGELIPVSGGRLVRGTWQSIILCEFDGPRDRRVVVQVVGEKK